MALDIFIRSVREEVAKRFHLKTEAEINAFFIGMEESAKDNQEALEKRDKMLRDTVADLCEAKRLLKAAVDDMSEKNFCVKVCKRDNFACRASDTCDFKWRYTDEALALIGEEGDTNG